MISKLFEHLYNKIFINIVVGRSQSIVCVEECNSNGVISSNSESFDTITMSDKMHEYIDSFVVESPFHYISVLDSSDIQGAIPTCSSKYMSTFCNIESMKNICHENKWTYYTSKSSLNALQQNYKSVGIDFIFSPFIVLANFFKDKIDTNLALYILIEENYITLSVFDKSKLLYGDHIDIEHNNEHEELSIDDSSIENIELDLDNSIDLEDIDAMEDMESLDDFGNIEDLDSIDEIDEFAGSEDEEVEIQDEINESYEDSIDEFNEDYQRFLLIQSSLNCFYKDSKYESKFVENVYIADSIGVSGDLKRYLEEEMFMSVFLRHLDLCAEVGEIAKAELK